MRFRTALASVFLGGCLLQAGLACWPPAQVYHSHNQRYSVAIGVDGIALFEGDRLLGRVRNAYAGRSVISDDGKLVVTYSQDGWSVYDGSMHRLADYEVAVSPLIERNPMPLAFLVDQARACWLDGRSIYVEFSQGTTYRLDGSNWLQVSPLGNLRPVLQPLSPSQFKAWLRQDLSDSEGERAWPCLGPLTPDREEILLAAFRKGNCRAALALGLTGSSGARPELVSASCSDEERLSEAAQRAVILLDGQQAAGELVSCLAHMPSWRTLELYTRVPCLEAIPALIDRVTSEHCPAALVAQTRVDFGRHPAAWKQWWKNRGGDKCLLLEQGDKSGLLWLARSQNSLLSAQLARQPALLGVFELDKADPLRDGPLLDLCGNRLIRLKGEASQPVLEWDASTGRPLRRLPHEVAAESWFWWNHSREILYARGGEEHSYWERGRLFWSGRDGGVSTAPRDQPPDWWPVGMSHPNFSPEGDYLQGGVRGKEIRISLAASGRPSSTVVLASDHDEVLASDRSAGHVVVSGSSGPKLRTLGSGRSDPMDGPTWVGGYAFSPDGKFLACARPLCVRDMHGGRLVTSGDQAYLVAFSPDSRQLAVADPYEVTVRDASTLKVRWRIAKDYPAHLSFDDTGRKLVVACQGQALVYDLCPEAPDLDELDPVLVCELWTGTRLWAGGARPLSAAEYWQRCRRLQRDKQLRGWNEPDPLAQLYPAAMLGALLGLLWMVRGSARRS